MRVFAPCPTGDPSEWSTQDVADWMVNIGPIYEQYRKRIIEHGVDGIYLLNCDVNDATEIKQHLGEIGVKFNIHKSRIVMGIRALQGIWKK